MGQRLEMAAVEMCGDKNSQCPREMIKICPVSYCRILGNFYGNGELGRCSGCSASWSSPGTTLSLHGCLFTFITPDKLPFEFQILPFDRRAYSP